MVYFIRMLFLHLFLLLYHNSFSASMHSCLRRGDQKCPPLLLISRMKISWEAWRKQKNRFFCSFRNPSSFSGRVPSFLFAILLHLEEGYIHHLEHARRESEAQAMSKLQLLIKQRGRVNTCIPVTVDGTTLIGNCISSLVDHLGFPKRDGLGRVLTYSLRPLSGGFPLSNTLRFVDVQLLPGTRLMLEVDEANAMTQPVNTPIAESGSARSLVALSPMNPLRHMMSRRTFVVGSVLAGGAVSGLLTGMTTAFATRQNTLPVAITPPATPSSPMPERLQQALLFSGHQQTVRAVAWSPDGITVASGADDGLLLLWGLDGQVRQQIPHPAGVAALAWSPAGKLLASGSGTGVRFFDGRTAAPLSPARNAHTAQVISLAWSQAPRHPLISGSLDRRAIVWGTLNYQPQAIFTRHTTAIEALSCQPGSTTVASASQGGAVRIWRVDTLAEVHAFYQDAQLPMRAVAFTPRGNQLAVGGNDGLVRVWGNGVVCQDTAVTAQGILCVDGPLRFRAHAGPVRSVSWSPDGRFLATGGDDGTLAVWAFTPGTTPTLVTKTTFADPVVVVAWSPVGGHIGAASGKIVTIWNIQI